MFIGVDRVGAEIAYSAESVRCRVFDLDMGVAHHVNQDGECLLDKGIKDFDVRAVHDGAKRGNGRVPVLPLLAAQVGLYERQNRRNNLSPDTLSKELQALISRLWNIVVVVGIILVNFGE